MKTLSDKPINLDPPQKGAEIETVNFYSTIMKDIFEEVIAVAKRGDNILLVGEPGTGKHRIAQLIHSLSTFSKGPFNNLFCNSLEETIQEEMDEPESGWESRIFQSGTGFGLDFLSGGTLFFKSFSGLSHSSMRILASLLYKAQRMTKYTGERQDFRIIISMKKKAYAKLAESPLWDDTLKKINPVVIQLPPLRERCEDIILLIDQFLIDYARKNNIQVHAISTRAVYKCISYYWPGNIRQLKNSIEHAATVVPAGSVITSDKLPFSIDWKSPYSSLHTNKEYNQSFLRAVKLLLNHSDLSDQELDKMEYEYRMPFQNRLIYLS